MGQQVTTYQLAQELTGSHCHHSFGYTRQKLAASHNRAVDAIQAGCMVIASPIPSYKELQKLLLLSDDFAGPSIQASSNTRDLQQNGKPTAAICLRGSHLSQIQGNGRKSLAKQLRTHLNQNLPSNRQSRNQLNTRVNLFSILKIEDPASIKQELTSSQLSTQ